MVFWKKEFQIERKSMENPIPEAELKPIVELIEPDMTAIMPMLRFRARNLPAMDPGARRRNIGAVSLSSFGLTCSACGHIMPKGSDVPAYIDYFSISGCKKKILKQHLYCPKCSSEIVMETWKIVSGATEYPPGAEQNRGFIVPQAATDSVSALAAATKNKLTIDGSSGQ